MLYTECHFRNHSRRTAIVRRIIKKIKIISGQKKRLEHTYNDDGDGLTAAAASSANRCKARDV